MILQRARKRKNKGKEADAVLPPSPHLETRRDLKIEKFVPLSLTHALSKEIVPKSRSSDIQSIFDVDRSAPPVPRARAGWVGFGWGPHEKMKSG